MSDFPTIRSLSELHDYVESHPKKRELFIFFDFDLTLIDDEKDVLLEPEVTKKLFKYLKQHNIGHVIVTARFYDTVCDDEVRNLEDMEENVFDYIHPILEEIGMDIKSYKSPELKNEFMKVYNDEGECVGGLYRGIFFGDRKGEIISYFLKQYPQLQNYQTIFVDDYDPYLHHVKYHNPKTLVIRRDYQDHI